MSGTCCVLDTGGDEDGANWFGTQQYPPSTPVPECPTSESPHCYICRTRANMSPHELCSDKTVGVHQMFLNVCSVSSSPTPSPLPTLPSPMISEKYPPPPILLHLSHQKSISCKSKSTQSSSSLSLPLPTPTPATPPSQVCKYPYQMFLLLLMAMMMSSTIVPVLSTNLVRRESPNSTNFINRFIEDSTFVLDSKSKIHKNVDSIEDVVMSPKSNFVSSIKEEDNQLNNLASFESNHPGDSNSVNVNSNENDLDEDGDVSTPDSQSMSSSLGPSLGMPSTSLAHVNREPNNQIIKSDWNDNVIGDSFPSLVAIAPITTPTTTTAVTVINTLVSPKEEPLVSFDFTKPYYNVSIPENSLSKVYATSTEKMGIYISDPALSVRYRIVAGDVDKIFRADHKHVGDFYFLQIRVRHGSKVVLNREYRSSYELRVRATISSDHNKAIRFKSKCNVSVTVTDINDISPIFVSESYTADVPEDVPLDTQVTKVVAVDPDIGLNGEIYYSLAEDTRLFAIHPTMGIIYTTQPLNLRHLLNSNHHESQNSLETYSMYLTVYARDRGFHKSSNQVIEFSKAKVHIRIVPVNRHSPQISIKQHSTLSTTMSNLVVPQQRPIYAVVHVSDKDIGIYGEICSFEIISGNEQGFFLVTNQTSSRDYNLELVKSISDFFTLSYTLPFVIVVQATDCGGLHSNDTIHISLESQLNFGFQFSSDNYYHELHENSLIGTNVLQVDLKFLYDDLMGKNKLIDKSKENLHNEMLQFKIINGNDNDTFGISRNGVIYTRIRLDRELKSKYVLVIRAQHQLNQLATSQVHIDIIDDNDNYPVFKNVESNSVSNVMVNENSSNGTVIYKAEAVDADSGNNGYVTYEVLHFDNEPQFPFAIDTYSGDVFLIRPLDYEMLPRNYRVFIRASDWGEPFRRQTQMMLNVTVGDVNDHRPQFEKLNCTVHLPINTKPYTEIMTFSAIDLDENSTVRYKLFSDVDKCFHLNELTGVLELTCNLRKELKNVKSREDSWTLQVLANDGHYFADTNYVRVVVVHDNTFTAREARSAKRKVNVECANSAIMHKLKHQQRVASSMIQDISLEEKEAIQALDQMPNRNVDQPKFDTSLAQISIPEDTPINTKIATFLANDTDFGFDGSLIWSLNLQQVENGYFYNEKIYFEIDQFGGELYLISALDYEDQNEVNLLVSVCDQSVLDQKCTSQTVKVSVEDVNDNPPEIGNYIFRVSEATSPKTVIGTVHATDKDSGDNSMLEYYLAEYVETFSIDLFNGSIRLEKSLDRESVDKYSLYVIVSDNGTPSLSSTAVITVHVEDVNDNAPEFYQKMYFLKVREDIPIGTRLTRISAFDRDEGSSSEIRYSLSHNEKTMFDIDELTGNIRLKQQLDYEKVQTYNLTITASDEGSPPLSTSTHLIIEVEDVNENYYAPRFPDVYAIASVKENMPAGTFVTQVTAVDKDNPTLPLIYQIIAGSGLGRFSIDSTGNVFTTVVLDCETHSDFWLTIVAKDRAAVPKTSSVELYISVEDVNDMPPITTESFYNVKIYENISVGSSILKLEARDQDVRLLKSKQNISFQITNSVPFTIDSDGMIKTTAELDCEENHRFVLDVLVMEPGDINNSLSNQGYLSSRTPVVVELIDVNEFEPQSVLHTYRCYTFNKVNVSVPVCHIIAADKDFNDQCAIRYELDEGNEKKYFKLDSNSGIIYSTMEYLPKGSYDFSVKISDCDNLFSTVNVIIRVLTVKIKEDNHKPIIDQVDSAVLVNRNEEVGHTVAWIKSMDEDYDKLCFSITGGNIDNQFAFLDTGDLVIAKSLRTQFINRFNLTLEVSDGQDSSSINLVINVLNDFDYVASFPQSSYTVNVLENITLGSTLLQMNVIENDLSSINTIFSIYSTQSPDTLNKFEIDNWSGQIKMKSSIDFESGKQHVMVIEARSAKKNVRSFNSRTFTKVIINVMDVNDETPKFILPYFDASVLESSSIGTSIVQVQAYDGDFGNNAKINYSILSGNIDDAFDIEHKLGYVYLTKQLNFREQTEYYLVVKATDNGIPPLSSTANVHLLVSVPDNSPPKFEQDNYFVDIREDERIGAVILSMRMSSKQSTFFEIVKGNENDVFAINVNNGEVYLRKRLDYEKVNNYTLTVSAVSLFGANDTAKLFISVIDINDNAPYWKQNKFEGQVFDTMPVNSIVLMEDGNPLVVQAFDNDSMHNSVLAYSIVEQNAREYFQIEPRTGAISLIKMLNSEKQSEMTFSVSVTDYGYPSLKSLTNAIVHIKYLPVNDCPPLFSFSKYHSTLLLPTYPNVIVTKVNATDCDFKASKNNPKNLDLKFHLSQTDDNNKEALKFRINTTTGQITTTTDHIESGIYEMNVTAFDGKFTSFAKLIVNAKAIPRSSLRFRNKRFYGSILENSTLIKTVVMPTIDGNKLHEHLLFKIMNPTDHFKILRTSGALLFLGKPIDREEVSKIELVIEVESIFNRNRVAQTVFEINVEDINDNQPIFVGLPYNFMFNSDSSHGALIGKIQAVDMDIGKNGQINYSIMSGDPLNLFTVHSLTGHLTLARTIRPDDPLNYTLVVMAKDSGKPPLQSYINVTLRMVSGSVPLFDKPHYNVSVSETHPPMIPFITLKAESPNGRQVFYNIESGNENDEFALDFNTDLNTLSNTLCLVSITEKLDRETTSSYSLQISATDSISGASALTFLHIDVEDANDNYPMFTKFSYNVSVKENVPIGSAILKVGASDEDAGLNSKLQFNIVGNKTHFYMSPDDGIVYLKASLDYETETVHYFTIMVTDYGSPQLTSTAQVWINVIDVNDNPPVLPTSFTTNIEESIAKGGFVTKITANNADWNDRGKLRYKIISGSDMTFYIDEMLGAIYVRNLKYSHYPYHQHFVHGEHRSRHIKRHYSLNVSVSDGIYSSTEIFFVHVKPTNNYSPKFSRLSNNVAISEGLKVDDHVFTINATDRDESLFGDIEYKILNDYGRKHFTIDQFSGEITLRSKVDYDTGDKFFWLILGAQDKGKRLGVSALRVAITDINDQMPRFIVSEYKSTVCVDAALSSTILSVLAIDDDEEPNTQIKYSIYEDNKMSLEDSNSTIIYINDYFQISSDTGYIYVAKNLSSLAGKMVQFFVKATNVNGIQGKQDNVIENVVPVTIQMTDSCSFTKADAFVYEVFVKENVARDSVVTNLNLDNYKDADLNIVGIDDKRDLNKFRVNKFGQVFVNELLDREQKSKHILAIQLRDKLTFVTDYYYVIINIMDENDCTPYFDSPSYYLQLAENQEVGSYIYKFNAIDDDIDLLNNALKYRLNDTYGDTFVIDENNGWLTLNKQLDRETIAQYTLQVMVSDGIHSNATSFQLDLFDINDNAPIIKKSRQIAAIFENSLVGTVVLKIDTFDADLNPDLRYFVIEGDYLNQFGVTVSGDVYVNKPLDREFIDQYNLKILVTDGKYEAQKELVIEILDINDNGPVCVKSKYVEMVSEAVQLNTYILTVEAVDADDIENSKLFFKLEGDHMNHFSIDQYSGRLKTLAKLDRETKSSYLFDVVVFDDKNRDWSCKSHIEIFLSDVNDEAPRFINLINSVNIPEDTPVGTILGKVTAVDADLGMNRLISYELINPTGEFILSENFGIIRLAKSLDRESQSLYNISIEAFDGGMIPLRTTTFFTVNVTDINDNAPEFQMQSYKGKVDEDALIGTEVVKIFATSKDTGINAEIQYQIVNGNDNETFSIDLKSGVVTVGKELDYENIKEYFLTVKAQDQGVPPLSSEVNLVISVNDVNDVRPQFVQRSYDIVIREDAQVGDRILQLMAVDHDSPPNANLTYSFASDGLSYKEFNIEPMLGILTVGKELDREMMSSYILEVFCSDNGKPKPLFSSVLINIEISDYNDNPPLFDKLNQSIHIQEGRPVGYVLQTFNIQDADGPQNSGPFRFEIVEGNLNDSFSVIDNDASLRTNKIFQHSNQSEFLLKVKVTDSGNPPQHSFNWLTMIIIQEPQMPPKLHSQNIKINLLEQFPGGIIGRINASDEDRFDKLTYTLTNDDDKNIFSIDPADGSLFAFPGLDSGDYKLNITVTDGKFISYGTVDIEVALITEDMVEHALVIEIRSVSVKDFVASHMKNFVRITKNFFNVRSKDVIILSVQPAERKSSRRHRSDELVYGDISIMFAVSISKGGYFTRNWLKTKLLENKFMIENQLGLPFEEVSLKSQCEHIRCLNGECHEDLVLSEKEIVSIISNKLSFVSPFHEYKFGCACFAGFGGKLCNITVNECYRSPCPPHKECLPVSSSLGYVCQCPFGMSGPSCNQNAEMCHSNDRDVSFCSQEFNPISFTGNSYVRYAFVKRIDKLSLRFRTQQLRTRIFTQQNDNSFNILEITGGFLQYRFDCGEGEGLIRIHSFMVNDGKWHEIIVERKGTTASLTLDRKHRGGGFAPGGQHSCNRLKDDIYFGAEVKSITDNIGDEDILNGFVGCLDNILFNGQQIPFHTTSKLNVVKLKTLVNVEFSCNIKLDTGACKSQPCLNSGTCTNLLNGTYECSCVSPRFVGKHCEIDTNPCESSPCVNDGVCHVDKKSCLEGFPNCYKCECPLGFTGTNCHQSKYCTLNYCQNGGICEDASLGPKCHCHTGWHGLYCQDDVDECQLSTAYCSLPATCINLPGSYRCICPSNSTEPCKGDRLLPSNVVTSHFPFDIEEIIILAIFIFVLLILSCCIIMCCDCRNRKLKKRTSKHNGYIPANTAVDNYTVGHSYSKNNLEMSSISKNSISLKNMRPTSYEESLEPNIALLSEEGEQQNVTNNVEYAISFKKNAPIASVSPQLIEIKKSPKHHLKNDKHRSKNSLNDLKENNKKRVSLNDSSDSNAVFNDDQPHSLTITNPTEGYHWDNSDLFGHHPLHHDSNLVEYSGVSLNDTESNSEHSAHNETESHKLIYQNVNRMFKNRMPNEMVGDESSPLLSTNMNEHTESKHLDNHSADSSPEIKLDRSKFDHTKNYIDRYLIKHDNEFNNNLKRKNITTYANITTTNRTADVDVISLEHELRKSSFSEPSSINPMLSTFKRSSLNDSGDNFSLLTPSSSSSTTPIAAMVASSSNSDTTDQCPSSLSSTSHIDQKISPVNSTEAKANYLNGNHTQTNSMMTSFGYGKLNKITPPVQQQSNINIINNNNVTGDSRTTHYDKCVDKRNGNHSTEKGKLSSTQTTYV